MSYLSEVMADAPDLYYRLADVTTTLADSSGNAINGQYYSGTYVQNQPSLVASDANASLDTTSGFILALDNVGANYLSGFTVECWFSVDTATAYTHMGGMNESWNFGIGDSATRLRFTTYAVQDFIFTNANISTATVYHLAIVFDSAFDAHLYLNGSFVETVTGAAAAPTGTQSFWVGSHANTDHFDGDLDEMALYPTELSAGRIAAHYAAGSSTAVGAHQYLLTLGVG
jgi:hypothetical protein